MAIVRGLITLTDMRKSVYGDKYLTATTDNDADFEAYISAATPVIENIVGPQFSESRTLTFDGGEEAIVLPWAFNTVTSVTVDGIAYTTYVADATKGIIYAGTTSTPADFSAGTRNVTVVVTVGNATIPPHVQLATRELVKHWWQIGRQANRPGVAESAVAEPTDPWAVPRRVSQLLAPSARVAGFA